MPFSCEILRPPIKGASGREYKYQVTEHYSLAVGLTPVEPAVICGVLALNQFGVLRLRAGYAWDGASGPALDTANFLRASAIHDALYQLIRLGVLPAKAREAADRILRRICREDGMNAVRAWFVYRSVRLFAGRHAKGGRT